MKVLVTGGAGYIGSITTKKLIKNGFEPVIFDNLSTGNRRLIYKDTHFIEGDTKNHSDLEKLFRGNRFDAVMHFAAYSSVEESVSNPDKYFENNVLGTTTLLETMSKFGVGKIIFSSSAAIFGIPASIPVREDARKNPINPYGKSKLEMEEKLEIFKVKHGINYISLRYFNAAGADKDGELGEMHTPETHLIPKVLKVAKGELPEIKIYGTDYDTKDGTCIRDFIHVEDLADAHVLALGRLNERKESYQFNLGSEKGYSVKEIIDQCEKTTKVKIPQSYSQRRIGDPDVLLADSSKAKEILGWKVKNSLEEMIEDAWNWENQVVKH